VNPDPSINPALQTGLPGIADGGFSPAEVFRIHPSYSNHRIPDLPLSKRAVKALMGMDVKTLGELDGIAWVKLLDLKNCGSKTFKEIVRLTEDNGQKNEGAGDKIEPSLSATHRRAIEIPDRARNWPLEHLPLSARLDHVLRKLRCRALGDLHGALYDDLFRAPDCGTRTVIQLQQLIDRIQRGEFGSPKERGADSASTFLAKRIDAFVTDQSPRYRQIFLDRVGGINQPMTLLEVGQKFKMTRERVRQIVDMLIVKVMGFGGPIFVQSLEELMIELDQKVLPLTPQLFKDLCGPTHQDLKHALPFYIRLLGWLSPRLSAWPVGQTPTVFHTPEMERIIEKLKKWFEGRAEPISFLEAYKGITTGDFSCSSFQFLEVLRYAAEFEMRLDAPQAPRVSPPVESPRRWAQAILEQSRNSPVSPSVMARAEAFILGRRSPRSDYRLVSSALTTMRKNITSPCRHPR